MDQKVLLKVDGMDCANCANTISKSLENLGVENVRVDFLSGEVTFSENQTAIQSEIVQRIHQLGYSVRNNSATGIRNGSEEINKAGSTAIKFYICLAFTLPLFSHMFLGIKLLQNPFVQLGLCLPVFIIGILHFGKSAYFSLKHGSANMDVLIMTGASAAFFYSLAGLIISGSASTAHEYIFFETSATIITLVLLGNLIEQKSIKQTTNAISSLAKLQPSRAVKIVFDSGNEKRIEIEVADLIKGDLVAANTGDLIPLDGIVISGEAEVNESMITGESSPVFKFHDQQVTGGTIISDGQLIIRVENTGADTTLSKIIELVKNAQYSKPSIQKLGDKVSAVFVPAVIIISIITFVISYFVIHITLSQSVMHSIAVLVISCPCAMGLATPTAVMAGLGRAAQNGILIKGGETIELLSSVKTIVFDKTGTLTTGNFKIKKLEVLEGDKVFISSVILSLENNSSHPIAKSLQSELRNYNSSLIPLKEIKEDKGTGINAVAADGTLFSIGSSRMVRHFHDDLSHDIYLLRNNKLIATIDLEDEIKTDAATTIKSLKDAGMKVILLSGDKKEKCDAVGSAVGITEIYSEKLPAEKLNILEIVLKENSTAMIGDGINDAPSLAKATVGISISDASDIAIQASQIILLDHQNLKVLLAALNISRHTFQTIRQNLFWAFFYNIVAIPVAAAGFLSPMVAALSMAFSDVIVIGNSVRLRYKKI